MTDSEKFDLILSKLEKLDILERDVQDMKNDMQDMKDDMQNMKSEMQGMKSDMHTMRQDINDIKQKVTKIDLTIENELCVNIQRVAEGHLDLSRNLYEAMKPSNEVEMLSIKVRMLESEVRDIKARLA